MCGSDMVPRIVRMPRTPAISASDAEARAGDHVAVAADVLGQRVDHEVGAERQRLLPERAEEGVVDDHRRPLALLARAAGSASSAQCAMSTRPLVGLAGVSR